MTRVLHRWTPPERPSPNLSVRVCCKCSLVMWSRHEPGPRGIEHWKEYFIDASDAHVPKMPECVRESFDKGSGEEVE